jgi:hypothetical protein
MVDSDEEVQYWQVRSKKGIVVVSDCCYVYIVIVLELMSNHTYPAAEPRKETWVD